MYDGDWSDSTEDYLNELFTQHEEAPEQVVIVGTRVERSVFEGNCIGRLDENNEGHDSRDSDDYVPSLSPLLHNYVATYSVDILVDVNLDDDDPQHRFHAMQSVYLEAV